MPQAIPFPEGFTLTSIIELNPSFNTQLQGNPVTQAFIETGSNDPHIIASLIDVSPFPTVKYLLTKTQTDSSGDNGVLITLVHNSTIPSGFSCSVLLLQKGALRYQNPRKFS